MEFTHLRELGRLDFTVEVVLLRRKFAPLLPYEQSVAGQRLT